MSASNYNILEVISIKTICEEILFQPHLQHHVLIKIHFVFWLTFLTK